MLECRDQRLLFLAPQVLYLFQLLEYQWGEGNQLPARASPLLFMTEATSMGPPAQPNPQNLEDPLGPPDPANPSDSQDPKKH